MSQHQAENTQPSPVAMAVKSATLGVTPPNSNITWILHGIMLLALTSGAPEQDIELIRQAKCKYEGKMS